jgi:HTH-type transcriptional regulator/antitoxin HigA
MANHRPAEVFPAGEYLKDMLEERGWTQSDLAEVLGRSAMLVSDIISAKRAITPETARGLADALDTSPELWMRLDAAYQLWKAGAEESPSPVAQRARIYGRAPIREMQKRGWIQASTNPAVLEKQLLEFFDIGNLEERFQLAHAAAKTTSYEEPLTNLQEAWLAAAMKIAKGIPSRPYSEEKLRASLPRLRELACSDTGFREVPAVLAAAGVRFVLIQALTGCKMDGATFWVNKTPVIAHSARYDRLDRFWFVLIHEVAHVLERDVSADDNIMERTGDLPEKERAANAFASETLVPQDQLEAFIQRVRPLFSGEKVLDFAESVAIHPAIVIGQLQHRGEIQWSAFRRALLPIKELLRSTAKTDGWGEHAFA